jgi:opacity protein-like surface antigen
MRRLVFAAAVIMLLTLPASAQEETPKVEVFGGYSYGGGTAHGWNGSIAGNVNRWFGIVADFGGQYTRIESPVVSERIKTHSLLFGPRFSARSKHVTPFAHVLLGAAHNDARARELGFDFHFTDTSFAVALGGGLDVSVGKRVAIRAFQIDYLRTNFFDGAQNKGRISAGVVFRFGKK